jgi:hypothetical protein
LSLHHRCEGKHVMVVRHVETEEVLLRLCFAIFRVGLDRLFVRFNRRLPAPETDVDV